VHGNSKASGSTIAFVIAISLAGTQQGNALEPATSNGGVAVKVVHATRECFSDTIMVTGLFVPRQEAHVAINQGSRVVEVLAKKGDQVKLGQILARATRQSLEGLPGGGVPSPSRPTTPDITLKAPAGGLVIQSTARIGATPSPRGEPLFRIMIDNEIELEVLVPSIHVPKLKSGQEARIRLEDGVELNGRVRRIPAEIDRATQLGSARLSVAQDPSLGIGTFARATIDASQSCGVAVPRDAVFFQTERTSVQVVRDRKVETQQVRLGLSSDRKFEISAGLSEGDVVVANAGTSLHDGDVVHAVLADELGN
jgi:multidrug efflux pump subunit AcrA (membrane-fusion protein)